MFDINCKKNFPTTDVILGDITDESVKKQIIEKSHNIVGIIGGPPCVAYSLSGLRDPSDPRGHLFKDYIDIVSRVKPKFIVMENVIGLLSIEHNKDNLNDEESIQIEKVNKLEEKIITLKQKRKHNKDIFSDEDKQELTKYQRNLKKINLSSFREPVLEKIRRNLLNIGYNTEYKILKAVEFGCPQKRERVIIIGSLSGNITYPSPNPTIIKTVRDAIEDLEDVPENKQLSHIFTKHSYDFILKIKETKEGDSVNPNYKEANYRCIYDRPSPTVKENHGAVLVHPKLHRSMTPRELARLQTFPDDFIFCGSKKAVLMQIGNAVPCKLSESVANHIKLNLL